MRKSYKGFFKPRNPQKYNGDPNFIVYRSLWELRAMQHFDTNPNIIQWQSDTKSPTSDGRPNGFSIPYIDQTSGRARRYYPDFVLKVRKKDGTVRIMVIEVKPEKETKPPKEPKKKNSQRYLNECITWGVNQSKWKYAKEFCDNHNWEFAILTEHHLGIK